LSHLVFRQARRWISEDYLHIKRLRMSGNLRRRIHRSIFHPVGVLGDRADKTKEHRQDHPDTPGPDVKRSG
jgi:hypothetical protein